jgi:multidrug resistance efflux pump
MDELPRIPIPAGHRWREFRIKLIPSVIFFAAIAAVAFIWRNHIAAPTYVGEVETIHADVLSTLPGLLTGLNVDRFDTVTKGEIIGKVSPSDPELLKASLAAIEIDLKTLQTRVALDRDRNEVNYEQIRLDWLNQRVELATAKVDLEYAEKEFQRQSELHLEKIVSDSEFELAKDVRDSRREEVAEREKIVSEMQKRLQALSGEENSHVEKTNWLSQAVAAQEAQLLLTEGPISLTAPIDGTVTLVNHRAGERVLAGEPIITITSSNSTRIVAFARQPFSLIPKVGDHVRVRTRSVPRKTAIATIQHVGSSVETMLPPVSRNNKNLLNNALGNPLERGLAFSVNLPENFAVYPGETVDLILLR